MARALRILILMAGLGLLPLAARANSPEDLVRWIYHSLAAPGQGGMAALTAPQSRRGFLSARMVAFYDANDTYGYYVDDPLIGCIDSALEIPGQDYDIAEVLGSLTLTSTATDTAWRVDARFRTFGTPSLVSYLFIAEAGVWKLDDVINGDYALMKRGCTPKGVSAPGLRGTGYCYRHEDARMVLDIGGLGAGLVEVTVWMPNGHSCSFDEPLPIYPVPGGWRTWPDASGTECDLQIQATPDGGFVLASGPTCRYYCGAGATMDGVYFPATTQVPCAALSP